MHFSFKNKFIESNLQYVHSSTFTVRLIFFPSYYRISHMYEHKNLGIFIDLEICQSTKRIYYTKIKIELNNELFRGFCLFVRWTISDKIEFIKALLFYELSYANGCKMFTIFDKKKRTPYCNDTFNILIDCRLNRPSFMVLHREKKKI